MNIEIGKISDRYTFLTHPTATAEILKLARKHPNYPITVLVSDEANSGDSVGNMQQMYEQKLKKSLIVIQNGGTQTMSALIEMISRKKQKT